MRRGDGKRALEIPAPQEWADEHELDLGPDANEPLWDGTRPDYDYAVSALLAAG